MLFFQIHIGDWETGTRLLSLEEKGVYLDLLTLYYKQEAPIMQMQCKRIARAYTEQERESLSYVLEQFFDFDGECYRNKRADEEIAKVHELSDARARAAQARWGKGKKAIGGKNADASSMQTACKSDANAMQVDMQTSMQNDCITDANQETKKPRNIPSVTNVTSGSSQDKAPVEKARIGTHKFDLESLPTEWRQYCERLRPDLNPETVFVEFKAYWTIGRGAGKLRSDKGWNQSWFTWCRQQREGNQQQALFKPVSGPKEPAKSFSEMDYGESGAF